MNQSKNKAYWNCFLSCENDLKKFIELFGAMTWKATIFEFYDKSLIKKVIKISSMLLLIIFNNKG